MKNWALVALAAFLPRRPAPGLLGDDVEVDRRRPRTLVEDFIKDARPYESALPNGVEPAAEVLQHFPETSFERCPELEAFTAKIRAASTSDEMLAPVWNQPVTPSSRRSHGDDVASMAWGA